MAKTKPLIIVESPAKAKTISRFLGSRYQVKASLGHIRDLPKSQFGVDIERNFTPRYITIRGKGPLLKELREAAKKTDQVLLATDPDREGEAISWHLSELLGLDPGAARRIEFHEITKDAVTAAIAHARPINMELVNAQQARRILDRVVGYKLSPLLWRKVRPGLSAGRVQSTALRLLVDRETEIENFQPEEYFTLELTTEDDSGHHIRAAYGGPVGAKGRLSEAEAKTVMAAVDHHPVDVQGVKERERRRNPPSAFTTSTLQQEAARRLGFTVRRTMRVAQQLYEGLDVAGEGQVGLITYIRTDSTRVAETARTEARRYIQEQLGSEWLAGELKKAQKERPGVQNAHEAIRPTSVLRHPDRVKSSLTRDQVRLYRLIWERFVASEMAAAVYRVITVDLAVNGHWFRATHSVRTFGGYQAIYQDGGESEGEAKAEDNGAALGTLHKGQTLKTVNLKNEQHFTEPAPRFSEASLVKTLEELGIGRPSTYVPTIETLVSRDYVIRDQRRLQPTELGRVVIGLLGKYFPEIVDTQFTAAVEAQLDEVEDASLNWHDVLHRFYGPFASELEVAEQDIGQVDLPEETTDEVCPQCERPLVVKRGRFGKFLACTGYPACQFTKPFLEKTGGVCPRCGKAIVVRRSRRGRTFYGCSGYPECDFVTWNRPTDTVCPKCGASMAVRRKSGKEELVCLREGCGHEQTEALG